MSYCSIFEFTAAVRGFHHYRKFWTPEPEQDLHCSHERNNAFDRYAIKVCELGKEETEGHLPKEISRITKFFIDRGATISVKLTGMHYRRSPIVQGGLEIPCEVKAKIPGTVANLLVMERYKQLVGELYIEPKEEENLGSYLERDSGRKDQGITGNAGQNSRSPAGEGITRPRKEPGMKDIRSFFTIMPRAKRLIVKKTNIVTID